MPLQSFQNFRQYNYQFPLYILRSNLTYVPHILRTRSVCNSTEFRPNSDRVSTEFRRVPTEFQRVPTSVDYRRLAWTLNHPFYAEKHFMIIFIT